MKIKCGYCVRALMTVQKTKNKLINLLKSILQTFSGVSFNSVHCKLACVIACQYKIYCSTVILVFYLQTERTISHLEFAVLVYAVFPFNRFIISQQSDIITVRWKFCISVVSFMFTIIQMIIAYLYLKNLLVYTTEKQGCQPQFLRGNIFLRYRVFSQKHEHALLDYVT